jgi:hypothetical protein
MSGLDAVEECSSTPVQTAFELEQSFAWEYDDLGRLTAETFDLGHDGEKVQPLFLSLFCLELTLPASGTNG